MPSIFCSIIKLHIKWLGQAKRNIIFFSKGASRQKCSFSHFATELTRNLAGPSSCWVEVCFWLTFHWCIFKCNEIIMCKFFDEFSRKKKKNFLSKNVALKAVGPLHRTRKLPACFSVNASNNYSAGVIVQRLEAMRKSSAANILVLLRSRKWPCNMAQQPISKLHVYSRSLSV